MDTIDKQSFRNHLWFHINAYEATNDCGKTVYQSCPHFRGLKNGQLAQEYFQIQFRHQFLRCAPDRNWGDGGDGDDCGGGSMLVLVLVEVVAIVLSNGHVFNFK